MKLGSSPYEQYKVSDNEWCEYLPSVWQEKRVKNIFNLITDLAPDNNDFELLSLYTSIGVKPRKEMEQRGNKSVTTDGYWIVKKGDIIVNKLLAWMGAIGLSEYDGVTSPAYDILRKFNNEVDEKFYTYLFRTEKAQAIFKKYSRGIMDVRLRLYFDKFGAITVPFPPPSEQKEIANYLDNKTAQIDRKIDLLTEKAKLYNNLKQSLINETVTRGLDKTVPMKNSGIEWIGEIHEHWEICRIKDTVKKIGNGVTPRGGSEVYTDSGIPFLRSQNVYDDGLRLDNVSFIPAKIHDDMRSSQLKAGDILINITGASIGRTCMVPVELGAANINQHIAFVRIKYWFNVSYLSFFLKSHSAKKYIQIEQNGASKEAFNLSQIANIPLVLPPLSEQKKIADYLDSKTAQIDQIIATINTQIEKLKELRKTLINDVVTGKIKVV